MRKDHSLQPHRKSRWVSVHCTDHPRRKISLKNWMDWYIHVQADFRGKKSQTTPVLCWYWIPSWIYRREGPKLYHHQTRNTWASTKKFFQYISFYGCEVIRFTWEDLVDTWHKCESEAFIRQTWSGKGGCYGSDWNDVLDSELLTPDTLKKSLSERISVSGK